MVEYFWRGKSISEMNETELRKALIECGRSYEEAMSSQAINERALGRVEMIKRGEA